jgi:hypothetical protein
VDLTALVSQATFTKRQQAKHCHVRLLHNTHLLKKSAYLAFNREILFSSHTVAAFNTSVWRQAKQAWSTRKRVALSTQALNQDTGVHALSARVHIYNSNDQAVEHRLDRFFSILV